VDFCEGWAGRRGGKLTKLQRTKNKNQIKYKS
jgi:hypothetical protein